MSEYYFAVHCGAKIKGGKTAAKKRDKIAAEVGGKGCGYTYYLDTALGVWRGWGRIPNRGEPFDREKATRIEAAWAAAGLE